MLKMIIVDDEKVIREAIYKLIDWAYYGIEITGLCQNGLEAFDMIVDESPHIVLTDIKMPGLNGLELIKKTIESNLDTQFILLSGYGEFEYAKEAMTYGVKHYLLKPCDEEQILNCVREISQDCYNKQNHHILEENQFYLTCNIHHQLMSAIINEGLSKQQDCDRLYKTYEPFLDFHFTPYRIFYVYYLEQEYLHSFLEELKYYFVTEYPQAILHGIYVKNTLLLFGKHIVSDYEKLSLFLVRNSSTLTHLTLQTETLVFENLSEILCTILDKIKRYNTILYINQFNSMPIVNYNNVIGFAFKLYSEIKNGKKESFLDLLELLNNTDDIVFLKQLFSSILIKETGEFNCITAVHLTEWLLEIDSEYDIRNLKSAMKKRLKQVLVPEHINPEYGTITEQVLAYVDTHLGECGLTLKSIAETQLFMNVDYVNKKFVRETGQKFSNYLTDIRIQKSKEYMSEGMKIQDVAEHVGCGNHPHYFSQLFKKKTGMTPTAYLGILSKSNI